MDSSTQSQEHERRLRLLVDSISNQLCRAVDGDFGFRVRADVHDETVEKLALMVNFVLDSARRAIEGVAEKTREAQAMEAASAAAKAADRAKSQFIANMSHEIRTPLTAIQGYADVLLEPGVTPRQARDSIDTIRRSGAHLLSLIDDILDVVDLESGRVALRRERCSVFEILDEVRRALQLRASDREIELSIEIEGRLPATILTDPRRLRQVLLHVLGNAVKFTERGRVRVVVRWSSTTAGPARLYVDVIDTGSGLSSEQRAALFHAFAQVDDSMSRRHGGAGVGLVVSRGMTRLLGGDLEIVDSAPGRGSHFRISVETGPLEATPLLSAAPATAPLPAPSIGERMSGRILLAEDGPDNRRLIRHLLSRAGLEVDFAHDGEQAVARALDAETASEPYDAILMDLQMPNVDGYQATERLRAAGYPRAIVALTAHAMESERARCLELGCDAFETKPIQLAKLLTTLRTVIAKRSTSP